MMNPAILTFASFEPDRLPANGFGTKELRYDKVTSFELRNLCNQIEAVKKYYQNKNFLDDILITVFYKGITPKTSRISYLFCDKEMSSFSSTVGARFEKFNNNGKNDYRHVITHYIPLYMLNDAVHNLSIAADILDANFDGVFIKEYSKKDNIKMNSISFDKKVMCKSSFSSIIKDASEIFKIEVLLPQIDKNNKIISFFSCFKTKDELERFLIKIGVKNGVSVLDDCTAILSIDQIQILKDNAPYVVCMADDFSTYIDEDASTGDAGFVEQLPKVDEQLPVIGVFDTYFDKNSFFSEYVDVVDLLNERYTPEQRDYYHGSKVTSILVMGHLLNGKRLNDHCGFFRVKHYIVGGYRYIDFETLFKRLEDVVRDNCSTIKVWNLSIGDRKATNPNYVSILGAKIDEISRKYNVLFVVSGTNLDKEYKHIRIGGPADSLNALVVNSVDFNKNKPSYARRGPALTFLQKPDISYYGGTENEPLICYSPNPNDCLGYGTSLSAPYIARKCAYLIHKCKIPVQCAKALLIDSAYDWSDKNKDREYIGYGVPKSDINEIVGSKRDEIKFIFYGNTKNQHTYISDFPILLENLTNRFNYRVKLTFCYFTYGLRKLGVDYAEQDISVAFGPVSLKPYKTKKGSFENHHKVNSVLKNDLSISSIDYAGEPVKVKDYGKWNNTKVFVEKIRKNGKEYKPNEKWGIMVSHLERLGTVSNKEWLDNQDEHTVNFGIVITLRTIDGTDARYKEFYDLVRHNTNYILRPLDMQLDNIISAQENEIIKPE